MLLITLKTLYTVISEGIIFSLSSTASGDFKKNTGVGGSQN